MVNLVPGFEPLPQVTPENSAEKDLPTAALETIERLAENNLSPSDPSSAAQEPLLTQTDENDLEAGIQKVAAKKAKKAKKLKQQAYLLEFEIPVLGKIKIAPFYSDDDDDDDRADKRDSLGVKENVAFAAGLVAIGLFSGYFYKTPFVSSAIAGGAIDISKTWYVYTEKNPTLRNSARAVAAIALIGSIALQYLANDQAKANTLLQVLSALPGVYPAMGILKAEIANAKPENKLVALANKCGVSLNKKTADLISSAMQASAGLGLSLVSERNLSAAGGTFFKTNSRNLSDITGKTLFSLENPCIKAIAGAAMAVSSVTAYSLAVAGSALSWYASTLGKLAGTALIVPPSDIASRTVKASIKADLNEKKAAKKAGIQEPEKSWPKAGAEALLYIAPIVGASAAVGIVADPTSPDVTNSGVIAALFGDIVAFSKVATKKFDEKNILALSALGVGASALNYGLVETGKIVIPKILYSSSLVFGSLAAAYAIYHLKRLVRPPELTSPQ